MTDTRHDVAAFLATRPQYDRKHVEAIAEHNQAQGVPFCVVCVDWHLPSEEHSS